MESCVGAFEPSGRGCLPGCLEGGQKCPQNVRSIPFLVSDLLAARTAALNAECCDETSEDCTGGVPHTCNAGCAAVFEPYWRDCRALLKQAQAQAAGVDVLSILESTFALCSSSGSSPEVNSQG
jgi:hypothetical protein